MNQNVARDGRVAELEALCAGGDAARGRAAFLAGAGACASCHRVGDTGATIGPDLSHIGRIRTTRDLLEAITFPNATIARGYESFQLATKDGRALTGRIPRETADTVFVLTVDGREETVPRASITKFEPVAIRSCRPASIARWNRRCSRTSSPISRASNEVVRHGCFDTPLPAFPPQRRDSLP